ncbi:MAG: hypothetical protein Q8O72_01360 [Bacteroidales bacterium]|nr:hypothetical protein [Bacteroidales bacterium]
METTLREGDDMKSVVELFESTVLHEITHFGDNARESDKKNSATYEVGKEFEKDARTYGKDVGLSNRTNKIKIKAVENDKSKPEESKKKP